MPTRVKKLPELRGRPTTNPEMYKRIAVLRDGNAYRFTVGIDFEDGQQQELANCIYYLGKSHGMRASIRTSRDRRSIAAQLFKRPHAAKDNGK